LPRADRVLAEAFTRSAARAAPRRNEVITRKDGGIIGS
jgi:hypothetical protein